MNVARSSSAPPMSVPSVNVASASALNRPLLVPPRSSTVTSRSIKRWPRSPRGSKRSTATFHTFLLGALPLGVLAFLPILIAFSGLIAIAPARAPGEPFIVIAMLGPASRAPIGLTIPALGVVVMDILTPIPATLAFAPAWGRFTIAPRRFVGVAWSVSFGLAKIALGIGVPASLVEPLVGFAVEIGRPPSFFVRLTVRLDDGIEPFANRHTGSACGVARRRARLRTETSEIPRTTRFHSQIQATPGAGFAGMSALLFIN